MAKKVMLVGHIKLWLASALESTAVTYPVVMQNVEDTTPVQDVTDLSDADQVSANKSFTQDGQRQLTFSVELWRDLAVAKPKTNIDYSAELKLEDDLYRGLCVLSSVAENGTFDTAMKLSVNGQFTGALTNEPL